MRLILFLYLVVFNQAMAQQLERLPMPSETNESALYLLKSLLIDSRYKTCTEDLRKFISTLTSDDEKELSQQESKFNASNLVKMVDKNRRLMKETKTGAVILNNGMRSVHFFVLHDKFKCQISLYPELGGNSIKVNLDPSSPDLEIQGPTGQIYRPSATLVGASANPKKGATIQFDPSKTYSLLESMGIRSSSDQNKIFESFQNWQTRQLPLDSKKELPPK